MSDFPISAPSPRPTVATSITPRMHRRGHRAHSLSPEDSPAPDRPSLARHARSAHTAPPCPAGSSCCVSSHGRRSRSRTTLPGAPRRPCAAVSGPGGGGDPLRGSWAGSRRPADSSSCPQSVPGYRRLPDRRLPQDTAAAVLKTRSTCAGAPESGAPPARILSPLRPAIPSGYPPRSTQTMALPPGFPQTIQTRERRSGRRAARSLPAIRPGSRRRRREQGKQHGWPAHSPHQSAGVFVCYRGRLRLVVFPASGGCSRPPQGDVGHRYGEDPPIEGARHSKLSSFRGSPLPL